MCDVVVVDGGLGEQGVPVHEGAIVVFLVGSGGGVIEPPWTEQERIGTMAHELLLPSIDRVIRLEDEPSIFEPAVLRVYDEPEHRNPLNPRQAARMNRPKRRKHKR